MEISYPFIYQPIQILRNSARRISNLHKHNLSTEIPQDLDTGAFHKQDLNGPINNNN